MMTPAQYRERLQELGRLAARLDADPDHPLPIIMDFFQLDAADRALVEAAYQEADAAGDH